MTRVILESNTQLYRLLKLSAEIHHLSLEEECCRRLQEAGRRLKALLAELRAEDEQRRATTG